MTDYKPQQLDKKWQQKWTDDRAFEVEVDPTQARSSTAWKCSPIRPATLMSVTSATTSSATSARGRSGCAATTCCIRSGGTPSACRRRMRRSRPARIPRRRRSDNIAHMKGQLQRLGISYAWDREIATCLPDYYKFNQWIFLKMYERGLAYRRRSTVNWCPKDNTVLANEQVIDGACWRCGSTVVPRELEQWFFRITAYADELLQGLETLTEWPEKVVVMQRNWIGRSEGARIKFPVKPGRRRRHRNLHHPRRHHLRRHLRAARAGTSDGRALRGGEPRSGVLPRAGGQIPRARSAGASDRRDREGRLRHRPDGTQSVHRAEVPIWVANFVLAEYGTGAIMAVPAHDQRDFEFARKYDLPDRRRDPWRRPGSRRGHDDRGDDCLRPAGELGRVDTGQESPAVITAMIARRRRSAASARAKCSTG